MNRTISKLLLVALSACALASCGEEKETNQTAMTPDSSFFANVGKGTIVFTLADVTLTDTLEAGQIELGGDFASLAIKTVTRLSETSFSIYVEGTCTANNANLGLVTLKSDATKENKENYLASFSIGTELFHVAQSSASSHSTDGVMYTDFVKTIGLYNGAKWIEDRISTVNIGFQTTDPTNYPLTNLSETSVAYVDSSSITLNYTIADASTIGKYTVIFGQGTNDFSISKTYALDSIGK